jgi:hypothetical protein
MFMDILKVVLLVIEALIWIYAISNLTSFMVIKRMRRELDRFIAMAIIASDIIGKEENDEELQS